MKKIIYTILFIYVLITGNTIFTYGKDNNYLKAILIADKVNIRDKPSIKSKTIDNLRKGTEIEVIKKGKNKLFIGKLLGSWYKIKLSNGKTGYIFSSLIKTDNETHEKFHQFYDKLYNSIINGNSKQVRRIFSKNFMIQICKNDDCNVFEKNQLNRIDIIKTINPNAFVNYKKNYKYWKRNGKEYVSVDYGQLRSVIYALYFTKNKDKWVMSSIQVEKSY